MIEDLLIWKFVAEHPHGVVAWLVLKMIITAAEHVARLDPHDMCADLEPAGFSAPKWHRRAEEMTTLEPSRASPGWAMKAFLSAPGPRVACQGSHKVMHRWPISVGAAVE
jgi:hypothetical protein